VTINRPFPIFVRKYTENSPVLLAGLFSLLLMLSGCQTVTTPEQVAASFWEAMAEGHLENARKYATLNTQHLISQQQNLENASIETREAVIDGLNAKVPTTLTLQKPENNRILTFNTILLKESDQWKVDYQQTLNNFSTFPFGDIVKSLRSIGDVINRELEQQIPLFEKQLEFFSEELRRQMEEFRRQLEKAAPPDKQRRGTI
jgi:hypothetical protein